MARRSWRRRRKKVWFRRLFFRFAWSGSFWPLPWSAPFRSGKRVRPQFSLARKKGRLRRRGSAWKVSDQPTAFVRSFGFFFDTGSSKARLLPSSLCRLKLLKMFQVSVARLSFPNGPFKPGPSSRTSEGLTIKTISIETTYLMIHENWVGQQRIGVKRTGCERLEFTLFRLFGSIDRPSIANTKTDLMVFCNKVFFVPARHPSRWDFRGLEPEFDGIGVHQRIPFVRQTESLKWVSMPPMFRLEFLRFRPKSQKQGSLKEIGHLSRLQ